MRSDAEKLADMIIEACPAASCPLPGAENVGGVDGAGLSPMIVPAIAEAVKAGKLASGGALPAIDGKVLASRCGKGYAVRIVELANASTRVDIVHNARLCHASMTAKCSRRK